VSSTKVKGGLAWALVADFLRAAVIVVKVYTVL
jgi:hypothetical protein